MISLDSRSLAEAMAGSSPNMRDKLAVSEPTHTGSCQHLQCAVCRPPPLAAADGKISEGCGDKASPLPRESSCGFFFNSFPVVLLCFTFFPTAPEKEFVSDFLWLKMGKEVRIVRAGVGAVIILGHASVLLELSVLAYKRFYLHE